MPIKHSPTADELSEVIVNVFSLILGGGVVVECVILRSASNLLAEC